MQSLILPFCKNISPLSKTLGWFLIILPVRGATACNYISGHWQL